MNNGANGFCCGYIRNSAVFDLIYGTELGAQGGFFCDGGPKWRGFHIDSFIGKNVHQNSITVTAAQWNVQITNSFGKSLVMIDTDSYANSGFAKNNVRGSAGKVLQSTSIGTESGTISLSDAGISAATVFPNYNLYPDSWRAFANPAPGYETVAMAAMIAELETTRIALGLS